MQQEPKFTVLEGETKGSKQVIFHYVSKVTRDEFLEMIEREFPDSNWFILPGPGFCMVTTGDSFEVKSQ